MTPYPGAAASQSEHELRSRARSVRAGLPGQLRRQRLTTASLLYGPLCSLDEIHARVARTVPWRFGWVRRAKVASIEQSDLLLSDALLLKYDDAAGLSLFSRFLIVTPAYYWMAQGEPWLVAEVDGTERWAVIARAADEPAAA